MQYSPVLHGNACNKIYIFNGSCCGTHAVVGRFIKFILHENYTTMEVDILSSKLLLFSEFTVEPTTPFCYAEIRNKRKMMESVAVVICYYRMKSENYTLQ